MMFIQYEPSVKILISPTKVRWGLKVDLVMHLARAMRDCKQFTCTSDEISKFFSVYKIVSWMEFILF